MRSANAAALDRAKVIARWLGTLIGLVGGFVLGYAIVTSFRTEGTVTRGGVIIGLTTIEGVLLGYLGAPYLVDGWRGFDRRLRKTPLPNLVSGLLGTIAGLVIAALIGSFVRDFPYGLALSSILAALLAVAGGNIGLTRRTELMALLGAKAGERERRLKAVLLDTSVVIDGRILDIVKTGFLDCPLVVTRSVLKELQLVADSSDSQRRGRGRRGLDVLTHLQELPGIDLEFLDDDTSGTLEVDARLVRLGRRNGWAVMTNDFNLNRVARLEGITVLNLNELAAAMRPIAIPGEELSVLIVKEGKEQGQGVGYLDDGTMVVVENGRRFMNQTVLTTVTSVLQTAAGRMIFAEPAEQAASARRPRRAG